MISYNGCEILIIYAIIENYAGSVKVKNNVPFVYCLFLYCIFIII